jgi:lipopolysaccharide assembly protein A
MRFIGYIIILILVLLGITFAVLNANSVPVNYYMGQKHMPLSLVVVISFGVGVILGVLVLFFKNTHLRIRNGNLARRVKKLEKKLETARADLEEKDE